MMLLSTSPQSLQLLLNIPTPSPPPQWLAIIWMSHSIWNWDTWMNIIGYFPINPFRFKTPNSGSPLPPSSSCVFMRMEVHGLHYGAIDLWPLLEACYGRVFGAESWYLMGCQVHSKLEAETESARLDVYLNNQPGPPATAQRRTDSDAASNHCHPKPPK